ncbi:MAG: MFS transporter [Actinomycetota bacterium]
MSDEPLLPGRGRGKAYVPPKHQHRVVGSPFTRLVRVHALMAAGEASMAVALADSLFLSITPGEARSRVILFLAVSFAPFVVLGRFIGPVIDRMPGGRRLLVTLIAALRAMVMVLMVWQLDSLFLFPLAFLAMVLNKTYGVSKSAMLPTLTRSESDLVEANAKLGVTAGIVGFLAAVPAGVLSLISAQTTLVFGAIIFVLATTQALRLPKRSVARDEPAELEIVELRQVGVIVASTAQGLIRASVGFLFFHLAFWFADPQRSQVIGLSENGLWRQTEYHFGPQFGTFWFGLAVSLAAVGTLLGNLSAKSLRRFPRVESLLIVGLTIIGVAGVFAAVLPTTLVALLAAALVNFAAAIGNMAFETIVQRDAPDANRGRALANFATRFQLMWVGAGLVPVALDLPGIVGFGVVGGIGFAGATAYWFSLSQLAKGSVEVPKLRNYVRRRFTPED